MRCATLWKSVAGVTGALALVLGSAGVAGAVTLTPTGAGARTASENPAPDCHSAEHAGLGMVINCQSEHKG